MLGYDWPRLHAALNDLPAALMLVAVLFDLAAAVTRRASLRTAGFWTMVGGAAGATLAVVSGLQAEDHIAHGARRKPLLHKVKNPAQHAQHRYQRGQADQQLELRIAR